MSCLGFVVRGPPRDRRLVLKARATVRKGQLDRAEDLLLEGRGVHQRSVPMPLAARRPREGDPDRQCAARVENASALAAVAPLEVSELYQFAALPPALVVVEIQQQSEPWKELLVGGTSSIVAALLYDLMKTLLRPRHRHQQTDAEPKTSFEFTLEEEGRLMHLHLRTDDPAALAAALDRLPVAAAKQLPTMTFDEQKRDWVPPS